MSVNVIAIDGPAASGKSTVASHLAGLLSIPYVNTGSMFRAIAWNIIQKNIKLDNIEDIKTMLSRLVLDYKLDENGEYMLFLDNHKLDNELRAKEVVAIVSQVATIKEIRDFLRDFQRKIAANQMVVMEGRDIGSVIFPDAKWKFFVTASPLIRAKRRLDQTGEAYSDAALSEVAGSIAERDRIDSSREIAPLKQCEDATLVDTSNMNINEVVSFIAQKVKC